MGQGGFKSFPPVIYLTLSAALFTQKSKRGTGAEVLPGLIMSQDTQWPCLEPQHHRPGGHPSTSLGVLDLVEFLSPLPSPGSIRAPRPALKYPPSSPFCLLRTLTGSRQELSKMSISPSVSSEDPLVTEHLQNEVPGQQLGPLVASLASLAVPLTHTPVLGFPDTPFPSLDLPPFPPSLYLFARTLPQAQLGHVR